MNVLNAEMFFNDFPTWVKSIFKRVKPCKGWDKNSYNGR